MTSTLEFQRHDRLLVMAPHPDDETLATGGILQQARAAGARVRVVIASDGDNNPWPQRWLERRWRIDAAARARWGKRRRVESLRALAILGVPGEDVRHLGWPDLGLTERLLAGADAEQVLADELAAFAPTHLAAPVAGDHHPDHNALAVLVELALARVPGQRPRRLGYLVHGPALGDGAQARCRLGAAQREAKRAAVFAHATQVSLSERRLLAIAAREECFAAAMPATTLPRPLGLRVAAPPRLPWQRHDLLLVSFGAGVVRRSRVGVPPRGPVTFDHAGVRVVAQRVGPLLEIAFEDGAPIERGYVKIERTGRRLVIYDCAGWRDFAACLAESPVRTLPRATVPR